MYVDPPDQTVPPGTVSADIVIADAVDLGGYLVTVIWDASVLDLKSITDGAFLGSTGRLVVCALPTLTPGSVTFTCSSLGLSSGSSGTGVLATLQFGTLADGTSPVVLADAKVSTTDLGLFDIERTDGSVTVTTPSPTPAATDTATPTETPTPIPTATPTPTGTPAPGVGIVQVNPQNQTVGSGTASVDIEINGVNDLGGYDFTLTWDSALLTFVAVTNGSFLGSTGRTVTCLAPTVTATSVAFSCQTTGAGPGPNGSGVLAAVQFATVGLGTSALALSGVSVTNTSGGSFTVNTNDGTITVQ